MMPFADVVLKAISDFKLLLRKLYPAREASSKIKSLRLKRTHVREASDIELYDTAMRIVKNLEEYVATHGKSTSYFGADDFLNYIKNILATYTVEGDKVIRPEREASRAVLTAIQLITLNEPTKGQIEEFLQCAKFISKYGEIQHVSIFNSAVKRNKKSLLTVFNKHNIPAKIEKILIEEE